MASSEAREAESSFPAPVRWDGQKWTAAASYAQSCGCIPADDIDFER